MTTVEEDVWVEPADVVLTRGTRWIFRAIRFFTRSVGESRTQVNHAGIITRSGWIYNRSRLAWITEALSRVKCHPLVEKYGGSTSEVAIFRAKNLIEEERLIVAAKAESYIGAKYGFLKLAAHLADWALQGAYVFRRLTRSKNYPICSWLVAQAFAEVGKDFGVAAGAASPDDIWDFCVENPGKYELIYPLSKLRRL